MPRSDQLKSADSAQSFSAQQAFTTGREVAQWNISRLDAREPLAPSVIASFRALDFDLWYLEPHPIETSNYLSMSLKLEELYRATLKECKRTSDAYAETRLDFVLWLHIGYAIEYIKAFSANLDRTKELGIDDAHPFTRVVLGLRDLGLAKEADEVHAIIQDCTGLYWAVNCARQTISYVERVIEMTGHKNPEANEQIAVNVYGATFNAPVSIGRNVSQTVTTVEDSASPELEAALAQLRDVASRLLASLDGEQKIKASQALERLLSEAHKPKTERRWFDVSANGLVDASKAVASLTGDVAAAVKSVIEALAATGQ